MTSIENKAIVLAADVNYTEQLTTTIKSILYNNKNVDIYVMHTNIMPDWFRKVKKIARLLNSCVHNIHINEGALDADWRTQEHISSVAYARYLIPRYIKDDKVLYLDSDIIVNGSLTPLFDVDLENYLLGAVKDPDGTFNSGMMLINNVKWREENLTEELITQTNETMTMVESGDFEHFNGDQTILNQVCGQNWLELDKRFNLQVGHDTVAFFSGWHDHFLGGENPLIIHYTTYRKPWVTQLATRYRDLWWKFYELEFSQLVSHHLGEYSIHSGHEQGLDLLTMTASQDLENLEYLAEHLPSCRFHIAAYTDMGGTLLELAQKKENIFLYPQCVEPVLEGLKQKADLYLDINHWGGTEAIVSDVAQLGKIIFSFYRTQNGSHGQYLFLSQEPQKMVEAIELLQEIGSQEFKKQFKSAEGLDIHVQTIDETLDAILETNKSVVRFGDGEFHLMNGAGIAFQNYDANLADAMKQIVTDSHQEGLLLCLPEVFEIDKGVFPQNNDSKTFWKNQIDLYYYFFKNNFNHKTFGSAFISRPYIYNNEKNKAEQRFEKIKKIWENRDVLIVEGSTSRSGVGNDLFDRANSIKRIICPSHNAYSKINEIQEEILKHIENRLVLLMLGPTAKVLTYNLSQMGYQAIDIGHIDSEYEWMKMGVETKVQLKHKHTAEFNFDQDLELIDDKDYINQIVVDLSKEEK